MFRCLVAAYLTGGGGGLNGGGASILQEESKSIAVYRKYADIVVK